MGALMNIDMADRVADKIFALVNDGWTVLPGARPVSRSEHIDVLDLMADLFDNRTTYVEEIKREVSFEMQREAREAAVTIRIKQTCPRCCGMGKLSCYAHIINGICFRCGGTGIDP